MDDSFRGNSSISISIKEKERKEISLVLVEDDQDNEAEHNKALESAAQVYKAAAAASS